MIQKNSRFLPVPASWENKLKLRRVAYLLLNDNRRHKENCNEPWNLFINKMSDIWQVLILNVILKWQVSISWHKYSIKNIDSEITTYKLNTQINISFSLCWVSWVERNCRLSVDCLSSLSTVCRVCNRNFFVPFNLSIHQNYTFNRNFFRSRKKEEK